MNIQKSMWRVLSALVVCLLTAPLWGQPVGQWEFNGGLSAAVGSALEYNDGAGGSTASGTQFGSTTGLVIPDIGGQPADVMRFPANTSPAGYRMRFTAPPNGGGSLVNQWTLLMDVLYTGASANALRALIDTDNGVVDADSEMFISASGGLGLGGQFDGQIRSNTWHRIGIVVDTSANVLRKYIDGVYVGQQATGGAAGLDGRAALDPAAGALLFADNDGQVAPGYVNSLQLRATVLNPLEMRAFAGPSAAGIPQVIPPVPSFINNWIPRGAFGNRDTAVGAVIHSGSTTIQDSSIVLKLDGAVLAGRTVTRSTDDYGYPLITVQAANPAPFVLGSKHTIELTYVDSLKGSQTFNKEFTAALLVEDFEDIALGANVDEALAGTKVWANTPPVGWSIDNTGVPGLTEPGIGVTEWKGWAFANKDWWVATAGDQNRSFYTKGIGTVAIVDPDEWDDLGNPDATVGYLSTFMSTRPIGLAGAAANTVYLTLDSSWRPEGFDDAGPDGLSTNNQTAVIYASFDGGPRLQVLRWDSTANGPNFHPDSENESVLIQLNNPAGANSLVLTFGLTDAANDWWWAIDNLLVQGGAPAPIITNQPASQLASVGATNVSFTVGVNSTVPATYQWQVDGVDIPGATAATYRLPIVQTTNAGGYRVVVTNPGGTVTSAVARLDVQANRIADDLVVHLEMEDSAADTSGRGNNGTAVGSVSYVSGRVGAKALRYSSLRDGSSFNYVTLGTPADLNFGTATDFSISFWTTFTNWAGDPSFIGNKNWNSGGNQGYVIATAGDGHLQWNLAGPPGGRKDYDGPAGTLNNGLWHHVVVSFDRNGSAITYLDGVQVNSTSLAASDNDLTTPAGQATNIGQDGTGSYTDGGSVEWVDGTIDDVGIWRRLLTRQEVESIYFHGQRGESLATAQGTPPPTITAQPIGQTVSSGGTVTLTVAAAGGLPLSYVWKKGGQVVPNQSGATLSLAGVSSVDAGDYTVEVSNVGGTVTSAVARVEVFTGGLVQDLVAHLKFEGNPQDSSGRGNNGTPVGTVSYVTGQIGSALRYSSAKEGTSFNYVTLGAPADLNFGLDTDFSVSFWTKFTTWTGDPAFVANKDWNSGGNQGWVIATASNGRLQWNFAGAPGSRKDYDGPGGTLSNGAWHHVVVAFDRNGYAYSYIDGVQVNATALTASQNGIDTPANLGTNIGQDGTGTYTDGGSVGITDGTIDDVGIWRRVVTPENVAAIYAAGLQGRDLSQAGTGPALRIGSIGVSGGNVTINWAGAPGVRLQKAGSLSSPIAWQTLTSTDGASSYTEPASGEASFYRLIGP